MTQHARHQAALLWLEPLPPDEWKPYLRLLGFSSLLDQLAFMKHPITACRRSIYGSASRLFGSFLGAPSFAQWQDFLDVRRDKHRDIPPNDKDTFHLAFDPGSWLTEEGMRAISRRTGGFEVVGNISKRDLPLIEEILYHQIRTKIRQEGRR